MRISTAETVDVSATEEPSRALKRSISKGTPGLRVIYARDWALWDQNLAEAAWTLFEQGIVDLVQRRVPGRTTAKFEYIAIKRTSG